MRCAISAARRVVARPHPQAAAVPSWGLPVRAMASTTSAAGKTDKVPTKAPESTSAPPQAGAPRPREVDWVDPFGVRSALHGTPLHAVNRLARVVEGLFDHTMGRGELTRFPRSLDDVEAGLSHALGITSIKVDVAEQPKEYTVTADLPGVSKENLKVDLDSERGVLTIAAEKTTTATSGSPSGSTAGGKAEGGKEAASDGDTTWHQVERSYGRVSRTLRLPPDVDIDKVTAKLDAGVLHLTLPKKPTPDASRRNVAIQ